jgi:1-phosphofructokinase family hexose kinase
MIYTVTLNPALDRELSVREFAFDSVLRATSSRVDSGGKGFNVSRALAALGCSSTALGFVGGATGDALTNELQRAGIETRFAKIAGETRTNISIVSEDRSHYLKVNEAGPPISKAEQDALLQQCRDLARAGDWWVLGGSLPPGVPTNFYAQIIEILRSAGAFTLLDTSGEPLRLGCLQGPTIIKPNQIEASELTGIEFSMESAVSILAKIHEMGVPTIVISLGKDGAILSDGSTVWRVAAPRIKEQNPIGAGDSLVAGLVWALSKRLSKAEALAWGTACGSAAASMEGTSVGTLEQVEELYRQLTVKVFAELPEYDAVSPNSEQ